MNQLSTPSKLVIVLLLVLAVTYHHNSKTVNKPVDKPVVIEPNIVDPKPDPVIPEPNNNSCDISLKTALDNNKSLIIVFGAEWCGFCRSLKKDINSLVGDKYELCIVDIDTEESKELQKHFGIKIVPTSIMVDPKDNKEVKRIEGYIKDNYVRWLK